MKKNNNIKLIIIVSVINLFIGVLLSSSISYAAVKYTSKDVTFTPNSSNWRVNNVDSALTSLYGLAGSFGVVPVGTINSMMGNTAPENYLICDGATYNIKDYPALAEYFKNELGSSNYFGGDGTTTFAVPDLRGEFLRGSGTNTATTFSGGTVGVHQDPTYFPYVIADQDRFEYVSATTANDGKGAQRNPDSFFNSTATRQYRLQDTSTVWESSTQLSTHFSSRPTNTSVLYVIASKDIYVEGKQNYSTDEKVVGTWIDGKPLYQKVIVKHFTSLQNNIQVELDMDNNYQLVNADVFHSYSNGKGLEHSRYGNTSYFFSWYINNNKAFIDNLISNISEYDIIVYVQYTKTTD